MAPTLYAASRHVLKTRPFCVVLPVVRRLVSTTSPKLRGSSLQNHPSAPFSLPSCRFQPRFASSAAAQNIMINASPGQPESADSYLTTTVADLMSLQDRVVVITGGAKGIGLALAFGVAEAGGKIAILDASSAPDAAFQKLQSLCKEVKYYQSATHRKS
jgi:hypothetical protein